MICKIVVTSSRPQCVKHGIDLIGRLFGLVKYLLYHGTGNWESSWHYLCHHRGRCRLSLWWYLAANTVMTIGIMRIVDFTYCVHGPVNIRVTIAIHCHQPRFLESESLLCDRVLNTLVRMTGSAWHWASCFEQWINFLWQTSHKYVNCALACLEIYDTGLTSSMHTSQIVPQSDRFQPNLANRTRPHSGTSWHVCEDVIFCASSFQTITFQVQNFLIL